MSSKKRYIFVGGFVGISLFSRVKQKKICPGGGGWGGKGGLTFEGNGPYGQCFFLDTWSGDRLTSLQRGLVFLTAQLHINRISNCLYSTITLSTTMGNYRLDTSKHWPVLYRLFIHMIKFKSENGDLSGLYQEEKSCTAQVSVFSTARYINK